MEAVGNRAVQLIADVLRADRVYLVTLTPADDEVVITHETRREDMLPLKSSYRSSDFPSAIKEIFERTIVYTDVGTDPRLTDLDRLSFAGLGAVGFIATCIRRGSDTIIWAAGALCTQPREWTPAEIALFENAVERTWAAVERARAEQILQESETQLKQLLKIRDEFIGIASHELKTPVTSIKAYAQLVQEGLRENNDTGNHELLVRLNAQINRLVTLINHLLDTTRISEGQLKLRLEKFDINDLLKEGIDEIKRTSNHMFELQAEDLPDIHADRERIGQVITNLLTNAIKYSPRDTKVTVSSRPKKGGIKVSVKDEGYGISQADQEKLFDRFFRVTANNMDSYPGMGLGLYITAQIIQKHNGTIGVQSAEGQGSVFSFTLPYRQDEQQ